MKRIALYIILFSYTTVMLKPVSPYISDAFSHIFYYSQHIATVHYENGKMHVHREVMDNAKKNESQKEIPVSKKENTANAHISIQQKGSSAILNLQTSFQIPASSALLYNYLPGEYPPPRA
ncbi:MAG: hypothetical protein ABIN74_09555 [Ferruginibacter sp.]